jgi:hypothetical protein
MKNVPNNTLIFMFFLSFFLFTFEDIKVSVEEFLYFFSNEKPSFVEFSFSLMSQPVEMKINQFPDCNLKFYTRKFDDLPDFQPDEV